MAVMRKDIPGLAVQLSPEETERFFTSPATRATIRETLTRAAPNGEEVQILHPDGWPLDCFRVLVTEGGPRTVKRDGTRLAVLL